MDQLILTSDSSVTIKWGTDDIHAAREGAGLPRWTDEEARAFLRKIKDDLEDRCIERGWEVLDDLLGEESCQHRDSGRGVCVDCGAWSQRYE